MSEHGAKKISEAMMYKLYEHLFGIGHDAIDIVQIRVYSNAGIPIPQSVIDSILGRTQPKTVSSDSDTSTKPETQSQLPRETTPATKSPEQAKETPKTY